MITATATGRVRDISFVPYDGAEQAAHIEWQLSTRRYSGAKFVSAYITCTSWGRDAQRYKRILTNDVQVVVSGELWLAEHQRALAMLVHSLEIIREPQKQQRVVFTLQPSQD